MRTLTALCLIVGIVQAGPSELEIASEVDSKLIELLGQEGVRPAELASDEDFLRRVSLDLAGKIPTPQETTLFGINPDSSKRAKVIDDLLESSEYSKIWASYWREVVMSRATEARARLAVPAFESWLEEQFVENRPWDEITREIVTATGTPFEDGEVGLIFAHFGEAPELAAETSRIFLGIQMSCANCHDHPTDSWKREEFHELAAYYSRVTVRREDPQNPRSFVVRSFDQDPQANRRRRNIDPKQLVRAMDRNRDGKLTKSGSSWPASWTV